MLCHRADIVMYRNPYRGADTTHRLSQHVPAEHVTVYGDRLCVPPRTGPPCYLPMIALVCSHSRWAFSGSGLLLCYLMVFTRGSELLFTIRQCFLWGHIAASVES